MVAFDRAEYQARVDKTKASMAERGIEVLLATNPANMCYLTGYDAWSFYVHQLVVLAGEAEPIWVGRGMDANAAKVTTFLDHGDIVGYPDDYVQSTVKHPMDFVADLLKGKGWVRRVIGVEMDTFYFTAACYESLKRNLPNARFQDATTLVNWIKVVKSPGELEYMSRAARIIEKVMAVGIEMVRPGVRQCDAAAAIYQAKISGTEDYGGKHVYYIGDYIPRDHWYMSAAEDDLKGHWYGELEKMFPHFDRSSVVDDSLFRFGDAQHIVDVGFERKIPDHRTPVPGVYLSNFSQIYPMDRGTNLAVEEGAKMAELILDDLHDRVS